MTIKLDRTFNKKTYTARDFCPDIDSLIHQVGINLEGDGEFFSPDAGTIEDLLGDFAEFPEELMKKGIKFYSRFVKALANHHVGEEASSTPDPFFWERMESAYPKAFSGK